jgi:hypothetical protein
MVLNSVTDVAQTGTIGKDPHFEIHFETFNYHMKAFPDYYTHAVLSLKISVSECHLCIIVREEDNARTLHLFKSCEIVSV